MTTTDSQEPGNVVELPRKENGESGNDLTGFVRDHPWLVIAGGVALGAVAASLLPRGTGRRLAGRAMGLAEMAGAAGALLGTRVRETAEATGTELRERGVHVAERLEKLGGSASGRIGRLGDAAHDRVERLIDTGEEAASRMAKKAAELRTRVQR